MKDRCSIHPNDREYQARRVPHPPLDVACLAVAFPRNSVPEGGHSYRSSREVNGPHCANRPAKAMIRSLPDLDRSGSASHISCSIVLFPSPESADVRTVRDDEVPFLVDCTEPL